MAEDDNLATKLSTISSSESTIQPIFNLPTSSTKPIVDNVVFYGCSSPIPAANSAYEKGSSSQSGNANEGAVCDRSELLGAGRGSKEPSHPTRMQATSYAQATRPTAPRYRQEFRRYYDIPEAMDIVPPTMIEGKPAIVFKTAEKERYLAAMKHVLVGKFSHGRPNINVIKEFFTNLRLKGEYNVSLFDMKHLLVECALNEDFVRLWLRVTWFVKGFPMRMFKWSEDFSPTKEASICPIWITLPGLPLHFYNNEALLSIANTIGKPLCIDHQNTSRINLGAASVCVELDVSKPLLKETWIGCEMVDEMGELVRIGFDQVVEYEGIAGYCESCLHLGHTQSQCKLKGSSTVAPKDPIAAPMVEVTATVGQVRGRSHSRRRSRSRITKSWVLKGAREEPGKEFSQDTEVGEARQPRIKAATQQISTATEIGKARQVEAATQVVGAITVLDANKFAALESDESSTQRTNVSEAGQTRFDNNAKLMVDVETLPDQTSSPTTRHQSAHPGVANEQLTEEVQLQPSAQIGATDQQVAKNSAEEVTHQIEQVDQVVKVTKGPITEVLQTADQQPLEETVLQVAESPAEAVVVLQDAPRQDGSQTAIPELAATVQAVAVKQAGQFANEDRPSSSTNSLADATTDQKAAEQDGNVFAASTSLATEVNKYKGQPTSAIGGLEVHNSEQDWQTVDRKKKRGSREKDPKAKAYNPNRLVFDHSIKAMVADQPIVVDNNQLGHVAEQIRASQHSVSLEGKSDQVSSLQVQLEGSTLLEDDAEIVEALLETKAGNFEQTAGVKQQGIDQHQFENEPTQNAEGITHLNEVLVQVNVLPPSQQLATIVAHQVRSLKPSWADQVEQENEQSTWQITAQKTTEATGEQQVSTVAEPLPDMEHATRGTDHQAVVTSLNTYLFVVREKLVNTPRHVLKAHFLASSASIEAALRKKKATIQMIKQVDTEDRTSDSGIARVDDEQTATRGKDQPRQVTFHKQVTIQVFEKEEDRRSERLTPKHAEYTEEEFRALAADAQHNEGWPLKAWYEKQAKISWKKAKASGLKGHRLSFNDTG